MKRGEIWDADIGGKAGRRPAVVLTRSEAIPYLSKVIVADVTTRGKGFILSPRIAFSVAAANCPKSQCAGSVMP